MTDALATEMARLSAVDCKGTFEAFKGSVSGVANGLRQIGLLNEQQEKALTVVNGALSTITGALGLIVAAKALMETKATAEEAKSVALTAAATAEGAVDFGVSWGKIALATGIAAATGTALYMAINNIDLGSFNLGTAEGQQQATQAVMEVI